MDDLSVPADEELISACELLREITPEHELLKLAPTRVCESLIERTPSWLGHRRAFVIDGTTITLSPPANCGGSILPPSTSTANRSGPS